MGEWDQFNRDAQVTAYPSQAGTLNPAQGGSTGLPFYLADPQYYGNVDPTTAPPEVQPGLAQIRGFNAAQDFFTAQAGPAYEQLDQSGKQLALQLQQIGANNQYQSGLLRDQYNNSLAGVGLQDQGLDIKRAALARQLPFLSTLHDTQNRGLNRNANAQLRDLNSSLTSRGAFTSINGNLMRSDISNTLADQLLESDTRYNESVADVGDQNKFLDLQGQQLGVDRAQMKNSLEQGLARLGLSNMMDIAQLSKLMDSNAIDQVMLGQQIFNQAIGASDYFSRIAPVPSGTPPVSRPTDNTTAPLPGSGGRR